MRAVVVLPEPPLPEGRAAGRCALALLHGLLQRSLDVEVIAARQHFAIPGDPPAHLPIRVVTVPPERPGWQARLRRVREPLGELGRGEFARVVREAAAGADVLHLEETPTAWCSRGVAVPALVHVHFRALLDRFPTPWQQDGRFTVERAMGERAAILRHRWLVASSPVVAATMRQLNPRAEVTVVPLCLRAEDYPAAPLDGPPVAGVIGTAVWPPTALAMRTLLRDVWPAVHRRVPEALLQVAGRGTAWLAGNALPARAQVLDEVPSASAFLCGLSVLVYPLRRGSGMKVKVLEAIACGVPVVTTRFGAEGIEGGDGVIVCDDMDRVVDATTRLLADPAERRQRGAAARDAFLRRYTPGPVTEVLVDLYRRMAAAGL